MKRLATVLKIGLKLIAVLGILMSLLLFGLLLFATLTRYRPAHEEVLMLQKGAKALPADLKIEALTWNIGYAGLGDDMDFFYDGGKQVRSDRQRTMENLCAIKAFLESQKERDIILLQEVDRNAKRSWETDIYSAIQEVIPDASHFFAVNYRSPFVPVPIFNPLGKVHSGLVTISNIRPFHVSRHSYPGSYPWPGRLFNLQRCFLLKRYELSNGRQLLVVNTHNSAFDDGSQRYRQMEFLQEKLLAEYQQGNYIIAGGDWNQCPPGFSPDFQNHVFDYNELLHIPKDIFPGWQWVYDPRFPTCRRLQKPYVSGQTPTTLIDFYLISPNVELIEVKTVDLGFINSDHNPVSASFRLKN